jgi:class I lanthipeptide synthase
MIIKAVVRTPKYSYNYLDYILGLSLSDFCNFFKKNKELIWDISNSSESIINEYYRQTQKNELIDKELYKRLIKYVVRAHTRSTPFGTLAAYSIAEIKFSNEPTSIQLQKQIEYDKNINLNFLNKTQENLRKYIHVEKCIFKLNPTVYCIDNKLRFIKFQNDNYKYTSIELNNELKLIFEFLQNNIVASYDRLFQLFSTLLNPDESKQLISKLHDEYILLSEVGIHVSDRNLLPRMKKLFMNNKIIINETTINEYDKLMNIEKSLKDDLLKPEYGSLKPGITIDSIRTVNNININNSLQSDIDGAINLLDSLNNKIESNTHRNLKWKFNQLYENQSIEFLKFIDPLYGFSEENNIIDDDYIKDVFTNFEYNETNNSKNSINLTLPSHLNSIYNQLYDSYRNNTICDLQNINITMSKKKLKRKIFQLSIVNSKGEVTLKYLSSLSLFDHISRFNKSKSINQDLEEMDKYKDVNESYKVAEFLIMPKYEVSNIICREVSSNFDIIPFASFERIKSIQLNQLRIRINKKGDFEIFDGLTNQIIIPIIRNNHNYFNSNIFIYKFLGELQYQYFGNRFRLDIGIFKKLMKIIPRMTYGKVILSPQKWFINITDFPNRRITDKDINNLIAQYKIPPHIYQVNQDKKLFLNLNKPIMKEILIDIIKKYNEVELEEYLYDNNNYVLDEHKKPYNNEIIFSKD